MTYRKHTRGLAVAAALACAALSASARTSDIGIETLSTRADLVSGGDVLVQVTLPAGAGAARIRLDGRDVASAFKPGALPGVLVGLVDGLAVGRNTLVVSAGGRTSSLVITNWPISGPIISGPHEAPYACTTASFVPFAGSPPLGAPLDADCTVARRVQYVYRNTANQFRALDDPDAPLPADVASVTNNVGTTAPYIVRLETGTINRAIYQIAILHNPKDPAPTPWAPPAGWNKRVIYPLGGGCQGGWYSQGDDIVNPVDNQYLGQGYAVLTATLNTFGVNCNDLLSSETIMMVKERFIEAFGVPQFTIGTGSSGGSYQSNQTSDNFPGLFDGIVTENSFPDVTTGMILLGDARLLDVYFNVTRPGMYTADQQKAISGFLEDGNIAFLSGRTIDSGSARRMDPRVAFPDEITPGVGPEHRYDPLTNPYGARGTVYDHTVNIYGRVPNTPEPGSAKFAQRPLDNVGVQYGLKALNDGAISVDQFLDLNDRIGGFDIDLNNIPTRTRADLGATKRAYEGGRILNGGGGLKDIPVITRLAIGDSVPTGNIHLKFWSYAIKERLTKQNGNAANQVILGQEAPIPTMIDQMNRWLAGIKGDSAAGTTAEKIARNRPADLVEACWYQGQKIVEPQTPWGQGQCNTLFPVGRSPSLVAGMPLAHDVIKCRLKAVDMADYAVPFSAAQAAKLRQVFSKGVCDWSKPGVAQVDQVPWTSVGPARADNLMVPPALGGRRAD